MVILRVIVSVRMAEKGPRARARYASSAPPLFLFGFRRDLDHLAAAVVAARADVVTHVRFAGGRIDGQRRVAQRVVRTAHPATRRRFTVFLNGHGWSLLDPVNTVLACARAFFKGALRRTPILGRAFRTPPPAHASGRAAAPRSAHPRSAAPAAPCHPRRRSARSPAADSTRAPRTRATPT